MHSKNQNMYVIIIVVIVLIFLFWYFNKPARLYSPFTANLTPGPMPAATPAPMPAPSGNDVNCGLLHTANAYCSGWETVPVAGSDPKANLNTHVRGCYWVGVSSDKPKGWYTNLGRMDCDTADCEYAKKMCENRPACGMYNQKCGATNFQNIDYSVSG